MPSRWALDRARELVKVVDGATVVVFDKQFVYQTAKDAEKSMSELQVVLAIALDAFHHEMLGLSVWVPKPGDAS